MSWGFFGDRRGMRFSQKPLFRKFGNEGLRGLQGLRTQGASLGHAVQGLEKRFPRLRSLQFKAVNLRRFKNKPGPNLEAGYFEPVSKEPPGNVLRLGGDCQVAWVFHPVPGGGLEQADFNERQMVDGPLSPKDFPQDGLLFLQHAKSPLKRGSYGNCPQSEGEKSPPKKTMGPPFFTWRMVPARLNFCPDLSGTFIFIYELCLNFPKPICPADSSSYISS